MAFVAAKGSELKDTATLLLALAAEKGIDPWEIRIVHDGFEVPEELLADADRAVLGAEKAEEPVKAEADGPKEHAEEKLDDDGAPVKAEKAPEKPAAAPKRRGRPPGSHNKPKAAEPAHEDHKPESE